MLSRYSDHGISRYLRARVLIPIHSCSTQGKNVLGPYARLRGSTRNVSRVSLIPNDIFK